ncbi:hypothetical protein D9611_010189 [Ephemerocybe angulata]|uniref:Uncharacterized protein n=1 Tax=Ephemerocybe angulata TaxID=980116 RepID=A0A8H5AYY8_9AGAR|nr:hypothetical protein D9611_010189 [Tulosesus angulatus]
MFQSKSIVVILLLAISQLAVAGTSHINRASLGGAVKHRTNAARMADGLAPFPPVQLKRRHGGGGQPQPQHPQTPTTPNKPQPSPTKPDCDDKKNQHLKCKKKQGGATVGYVSKDWSKKGKRGFGLCSSNNDALKVDFENSVTPFPFKLSSGGKDSFPYLGFSGNNLKPGSGDSAVLTGTQQTNRGNAPSNVGNAFSNWSANSESTIWHYTRSSKLVESKWVNTGGVTVDSKVFYDPSDDLFHLVTGDATAFNKKCPNAYEVELSLED